MSKTSVPPCKVRLTDRTCNFLSVLGFRAYCLDITKCNVKGKIGMNCNDCMYYRNSECQNRQICIGYSRFEHIIQIICDYCKKLLENKDELYYIKDKKHKGLFHQSCYKEMTNTFTREEIVDYDITGVRDGF